MHVLQAMMAMVIGASLCTLAGPAGAQTASASAPAATKAPSQCFYSHDWDGWKASPDSKSIYIRVGVSHYYKIDFSGQLPDAQRAQRPPDHQDGQ